MVMAVMAREGHGEHGHAARGTCRQNLRHSRSMATGTATTAQASRHAASRPSARVRLLGADDRERHSDTT